MAKQSVQHGKVRKSKAHKSKDPAFALSREMQRKIDEHLGSEFLGMRAALIAARTALQGKGIYGDIATSLQMHVENPLRRIAKFVAGREDR